MDSSQRTRLLMEAANQFVARAKTVDSSLLTMKNMQRAAYAGAARFKTPPYYNGSPTLNPILYDISSCPINHSYTEGYSSVTSQTQQESRANESAGAVICCEPDYSRSPQFVYLQNASTCNTILTSYNNNVSFPSGPNGPPASAGLTAAYWAQVAKSSSGINNNATNPILQITRYTFPKFLPAIYFQGNSFIQASVDTIYPTINTSNTSGPDDFTIDFYMYPTASGVSTQTIFYIGAPGTSTNKLIGDLISTGTAAGLNTKYTFQLQVSTVKTVTFGEFLIGNWYYVSIMRYGSTIYYYQNGSLMGFINLPAAGIPSSTGPITNYLSGTESTATIGGRYDSGSTALATGFNGYLTSFRWTKGLAIWLLKLDGNTTVPNSITPPSVPVYINSVNTVYTPLEAYVAVGLLAGSAATLLTNTRSPIATVSLTDGSAITVSPGPNTYTAVTWIQI